jgi:hypothetical protein
MSDFGEEYTHVPRKCASTSAISVSKIPMLHSKTKHIEVRYHFMRDNVEKGKISLIHVSTHDQLADILKDRYGEPERGGSEWEPIKILLEGDQNSNKMNTASNTRLRLKKHSGKTKPRVYRPTPVRPVSTTGQTGPCW